jgi:hypothetical protein
MLVTILTREALVPVTAITADKVTVAVDVHRTLVVPDRKSVV